METLWRNRALTSEDKKDGIGFEIYVQPGFSHFELSSVIAVLKTANDILEHDRFDWHITSDLSGLVSSEDEILVRTEPSIGDQYLKDCMVVVGGADCSVSRGWVGRVRAMQRERRPVVLFSDSASAYIKTLGKVSGALTTHWRDVAILHETGHYPTLTTHLAEVYNGVVTCAGQGFAAETILRLISEFLSPNDSAVLANMLMIDNVRAFDRDQPKGMGDSVNFFEKRLQRAISIMEETAEHPIKVIEIANQIGVSSRQLERLFMLNLNLSPARFYRLIRVKRAHVMITETKMALSEVAVACGFSSSAALSRAYQAEFSRTPKQVRMARR